MDNRSINLSNVPRKWNLAPPVTVVTCMDFRYAICREISDLQIAYHPSGYPETAGFSFNGEDYEVGYPHILIKRPGVLRAKPGRGRSLFFKYDISNAPELPDDLVASELPRSPELESLAQRIYALMEHSFEYGVPDRIDALCLEFLCTMLALREQPSAAGNASAIRAAGSWMMAHPGASDIDQIARKFGFSRRNFDRCYRAEFGISPGRNLLEYRMLEAMRMLTETASSIEEISSSLGYSDPANFIAAFRRRNGITPYRFRTLGKKK